MGTDIRLQLGTDSDVLLGTDISHSDRYRQL